MSKINLQDIASLTNEQSAIALINQNSAEIETKSDTFLSRNGTIPNQMESELDMNSNRILNIPEPASANEPLRLQDLSDFIGSGSISTGISSPLTSTDNAIVRWNGTGGSAVQNSGVFVDDTGVIHGGTASDSTLTLESTTGSGTTDKIQFKTGAQTTRLTIASDGTTTSTGNILVNRTLNGSIGFNTAQGSNGTSAAVWNQGTVPQGGGLNTNPGNAYFGVTSPGYTLVPILTGRAAIDADANTNGIILNCEGAQPIVFATSGTEVARITGTTLDLTTGQLKFPATANPSSNVNTLDDYEEGTFTPVLTFATPGNLNVVYSIQVGTYTKIGRLVNVQFDVLTSTFTHTTASGGVLITGLPFTAGNNSSQNYVGSTRWQGITKATYTQVNPVVAPSTSSIQMIAAGSAVAESSVIAADMPTGGTARFMGAVTYLV